MNHASCNESKLQPKSKIHFLPRSWLGGWLHTSKTNQVLHHYEGDMFPSYSTKHFQSTLSHNPLAHIQSVLNNAFILGKIIAEGTVITTKAIHHVWQGLN
jgi:hypothetical protein